MVIPSLNTLSLKEKIGQMIVVRASGHLFDRQIRYPSWEASAQKLKYYLKELNIGGVIFLGGSAAELSVRTQQIKQYSKIPPFLAADIEEGVGQRFAGATWFPPPMNLGAIAQKNPSLAQRYATAMGEITAQEALAIGLNWILAPVVDVNNNPDNPVINIRAFGDTPEIVADLASAFIKGTQTYPILTTAKHFPGHGDTATDSHLELPVIPHSAERLAKIELPPFEKAIASGVDTVMSAHLIVSAWDREYPATLSPTILTDQLRKNLGFERIIVTDALIMSGITSYAPLEEISIRAIEAGADILLMPEDAEIAINSVYQAVKLGRLSGERIDASVERIWQAKQKIDQPSSYSLERIAELEYDTTADEIITTGIEHSLNIPLDISINSEKLLNLVLIDDFLKCDFLERQSPAITMPSSLGYEFRLIESNHLPQDINQPILLQIFSRANPFLGRAGLTAETYQWLKKLLKNKLIQALVIYGSPYVLNSLKQEMQPDLSWVFTFGQMPNAQKIALQTLFTVSTSSDLEKEQFL